MKNIFILLILSVFSQLALSDEVTTTTEQLIKEAENGDTQAQLQLGNLYFNGDSGVKDFEKALAYYKKAANGGEKEAMSNICNMYWYGNGVPKDRDTASEWCKKGEKLGSTNAMVLLGEMAMDQDSNNPNAQSEAFQYFKKAAELDHPHAQFILGVFFDRGITSSPDREKAIYWYKKAALFGHPQAIDALKKLGEY